jgi:hypothetical protein
MDESERHGVGRRSPEGRLSRKLMIGGSTHDVLLEIK